MTELITDVMIFTQGIAGGTLLYVVMFEVLNRERTKNVAGLVQLAGILVGFASMLMIEIFGEFFKKTLSSPKTNTLGLTKWNPSLLIRY